MKKIQSILVMILGIIMLFTCKDEVGNPNIDSRDFIEVKDGKAMVDNDGTYYILTEYEHPDTVAKYNLKLNVYIVDRQEDADKIKSLGGAQYVNFSGIGMITDYRPTGTDMNKKHYNIMLTSISAREME